MTGTEIAQPIIIVGTGRCGSTVFHRLLATHPRTMWLSGFAYLYPHRPTWNRWAVAAMGHRVLRRLFGGWVRANEQYRFWDAHTYGCFSEPCRDLVASDVTERVRRQVRAAFAPMLNRRRDRLLLKITGWPRLGFLREVFPDAKFIHIVRDGRAVASSLLHIDFWRGWYGPQGWRAGLLTEEDQATWDRYDRSFVALAGLEWRIQMRAMDAARRLVPPEQFLEVRYEAFCQDPMEVCRRVLAFADLAETRGFMRDVRSQRITNTSERWRKDLTPAQQALLDELLDDDLRRYGYPTGRASGAVPVTATR